MKNFSFKGFTLLVAAMLPGVVQSQTATQDTSNFIHLDHIVINATRVSQKGPVTYTDISHDDISRYNYGTDIASLLQLTPSIVSTSDAGNGIGYTDIRLRGMDGTRINVTANGVPMNDAESHKVYWVDTPDLLSSVENLQIQRGVGSSTNGAGAFGGSINLATSASSFGKGGEVSFSYGSFTTHKEAVKWSSGLVGNGWVFDGRFSHIFSHGYMDRASSNLTSYLVQGAHYGGKMLVKFISFGGYERTYNVWYGLTIDQMKANRTYNPCGEIFDAEGNLTGFYEDQTDNYTQINNQLVLSRTLNDRWTANVTLHYTYGKGHYNQWKNDRKLKQYGFEVFPIINGEELTRSNLARKKQMGNDFGGLVWNAQYQYQKTSIVFGGAWNIYDGDHWGNVLAIEKYAAYHAESPYYKNSSTKTDFNVFTKVTYEMLPGLHAYGDVQYRRIHHKIHGKNASWSEGEDAYQTLDIDHSYDFFNPKVGLNYALHEHHLFNAVFGVAQKEPTRDDFVNATSNLTPNPETLYDWEVGYQYLQSWLHVGLNFYWMQFKDQLILTGAINPDTYDVLYFNASESYRRGMEVSWKIIPVRGFTLGGNATWSRNRIQDYSESIYSYDTWDNVSRKIGDTEIAYSPKFTGGAMARFQKKGFEAEMNIQHVGKQYINNSQNETLSLPKYTVAQLSLSYAFTLHRALKNCRLGVQINNLFDQKYCSNAYIYDAGTSAADGDWYDVRYFPQATRNFLANLTFSF